MIFLDRSYLNGLICQTNSPHRSFCSRKGGNSHDTFLDTSSANGFFLKIKKAILKKEWPFRKFPFRNLQGFFHIQPLAER